MRPFNPPLTPAKPRISAFWPCVCLGACLIALKLPYVSLLEDVPETASGFGRAAAILSASDLLFALGTGLLTQLIIVLNRRRPKMQRATWLTYFALSTVAVFWAVMSLRLAQVMRMPLTYPLLYLAGDLKNMQSSVGRSVSPGILAAFAAIPAIYIALVLIVERYCRFQRTGLRRVLQCLVALGICSGFVWARVQVRGEWGRQEDSRALTQNSHMTFAGSLINALFHGGAVDLHEQYPAELADDFKTVDARQAAVTPTPGLPRGAKNVIVVVGESICTEHLSLYGSRFKTWPHMEAESENAIVFNNFYSHITNTANSLVALTLSVYPPMGWREFTVERPGIPGNTVAQVLKAQGYRTAFISAGNNEFSGQDKFLKNRGYDTIQDAHDIGGPQLSSWGVDDKSMVNQIFKFIDSADPKPFFLFTWTQGTHHPYEPGPDWETVDFLGDDNAWGDMGWDLNRYLNALKESDIALGNLFAGLRQRGLAEDTIVIVTGDHGQAFGRPHKTYFHSGRVYQEDVRVPLMIWNPKLFKTAPRSEQIGAHVDLSPTILDLLGVSQPASFQGRSLFDPTHPPRAYFYGAMDNYILGVREQELKYIFNATSGREELYDLSRDPEEQHNLAEARPKTCQPLRQRLGAWLDYQKKLFPRK